MKSAISLIELILAIVIVGIGVTALPTIALVSSKANAQTVVSEVVTSTRIFMDDILLEPYNSVLANGFSGADGATLYTGIIKTKETDDGRFSNNKHFSRTLAVTQSGQNLEAKDIDTTKNGGINTYNNAQRSITANSTTTEGSPNGKNLLEFESTANVQFLKIEQGTIQGGKLSVVFDIIKQASTSTNATMVEITSKGKDGASIIDDIDEIKLRGFAFNISVEPK